MSVLASSSAAAPESSASQSFPWTSREEQCLKETRDRAQAYRWMHYRSSVYYNWLDMALGLPSVMLSAVSSTAAFAAFSDQNFVSSQFITVAVGVLALINTLITSARQFLRHGTLATRHKDLANSFCKLYRKINRELVLPRGARSDCRMFLVAVDDEYGRLQSQAEAIPDRVLREFEAVMLGKNSRGYVDFMVQSATSGSSGSGGGGVPPSPANVLQRVTQRGPSSLERAQARQSSPLYGMYRSSPIVDSLTREAQEAQSLTPRSASSAALARGSGAQQLQQLVEEGLEDDDAVADANVRISLEDMLESAAETAPPVDRQGQGQGQAQGRRRRRQEEPSPSDTPPGWSPASRHEAGKGVGAPPTVSAKLALPASPEDQASEQG